MWAHCVLSPDQGAGVSNVWKYCSRAFAGIGPLGTGGVGDGTEPGPWPPGPWPPGSPLRFRVTLKRAPTRPPVRGVKTTFTVSVTRLACCSTFLPDLESLRRRVDRPGRANVRDPRATVTRLAWEAPPGVVAERIVAAADALPATSARMRLSAKPFASTLARSSFRTLLRARLTSLRSVVFTVRRGCSDDDASGFPSCAVVAAWAAAGSTAMDVATTATIRYLISSP